MADEPLSSGAGGMLGANHLQSSIDSLKRTIDSLNQGLSHVVPQLQQMNRMTAAGGIGGTGAGAYPSLGFWGNNGGHGPAGGGQPPRGTNGGGATFGGQSPGQSGGQGQQPGQPGQGSKPSLWKSAQGASGIAVAAGAAANSGLNSMVQRGGPGMYTADLIASQLSLGGANTRQATLNSMLGQSSGLSMADVAQGRYTLSRGLGIQSGSGTDLRAQAATGIAGLINPGIGNAQVAGTMAAINAPATAIKLRGLGIDTGKGPGNHQDPLTLANQILQKIGNWQQINTSDKINFHLDDPNGAVESTLRNWEAHGFLPQGSRDVIKEEIRAILIARMNGTNFASLQQLGADANSANRVTRNKALGQLQKAGVNPTSIVGEQKKQATALRDRDINMTDSFAAGARTATDALTAFTDAINVLLKGPLGSAVGFVGGAKGAAGGGSGSDIGAMSNQGTGGSVDAKLGNSSQGTPLTTSVLGSGSNAASGAPGTQSGSAKATGTGRRTIKFIKPVAGSITSGFGSRKDPITGRGRMHTGVDFGASSGTPIHAAAAGTVTFSGSRGANYWAGNHVIIDHGGGYETLYAHQSRVKARVGSTVQQGEVIGYVGSTGRATGAHLHFEIHINGRAVDPAPFLAGAGVAISGSSVSSASSQGTAAAAGASSNQPSAATMAGSAGSGVLTSEREALMAFSGGFRGMTASSGNTGSAPTTTNAPGTTSTSSSNNATANSTPSKGSGVERWRNVALQALQAAGAPTSWIGSLLHRMNQESSGDPNAVNNWDSNAKAGHPSRGLMQTIPGTFDAYAGKYRSRGITDPFANIYAAIKYTIDRYGSGPAGWNRSGGYAKGAWELDRDQAANVHKGEMIIPAEPAKQIRDAIRNPSKGGNGLQITIQKGAITITTTAGVTPSGVNDLGKAIADALAQHDSIKKLQKGVLA